jgi:type VI secretion system protein ImpL
VLSFLSENLVIVALLALTLIALALLGLVFWAALQNEDGSRKRQSARPKISSESLKQSFRTAVELIETNLATRSERYNLAWALVLNEGSGEGEDDRQLPLVQSGIPSALSADATLATSAVGMGWNFFDKGVAVQLQSAYLGSPDDNSAVGQQTWDEFLGLCRGYRPDRPFDSIVLSVPAGLFLASDPQSQLELAARAKAIHRRLWLAQNRFALRFPIYLVVSGCERIPGFSRFAAALPEGMRRGMLGWSSPYEVGAPYQPQWMDLGMDEITRDVSDATAELCALEPLGEDSADYFMLATDVEKLRGGLKLFMDELMRPSAYHEPFIFRGFYLTGDCSPVAELLGREVQPQLEAPEDVAADVPAPLDDSAVTALPVPMAQAGELEPAFLRDVFEKKVFPEAGLVRGSTVQRMRHTHTSRAVRWGAATVVGVWAVGLAYSCWRLDNTAAAVQAALQQLDRDSRAALQERAEDVDLDRSRDRALKTLETMERVDAGQLWSVFMPGSWSAFDDLQGKLGKRMEASFSHNSIEPLRLSFYSRVSRLTGAPLDLATGQLIVGGGCIWRGNAVGGGTAKAALNPEDLPEYAAASSYLAQLEELDRAVRAFERLRVGSDAPSNDLKLVVRTLLGRELPGNAARTAALFRQQAQSAAPLRVADMEAAARCAFQQSLRALHERLFDRNDLLAAERQLNDRLATLGGDATINMAPPMQLANWQGVLDAMRDEEGLLQPGKGAWIKRRTLQLGQAYEGLLARAQGITLIGGAEVGEGRKQAEDAFGKFLATWDETQADRRSPALRGLRWLDAENRWALSEERAALRDSLAALLAQPYMRPGRGKLPDVPAVASVAWDRNRLDQALAFSDSRKKFQAELLPKFPPALQQGVERMANAVLAEQMIDVLAQGMVLTERASSAALVDADRQRLARVRVLLSDLGARSASDTLGTVLVRDARARLRVIDDAFMQGDVFVPRDIRNWSGEKGPLVAAFGAGDAMGLASYVAQQQAFIESSAREAETLLAAIEGPEANDPMVQRWRGIVGDVAKYRLKSPASSLQNLEQFVLNAASDVDRANCVDKLAKFPPRRGGDVFGERLANLQVRLAGRCRELRNNELREGWAKFAEVFNRDLAGRAPFKTGLPLPADRPPADIEEVSTALKAYERAWKTVDRAAATPTVKRFDEQMERVRAFMAPLFSANDNAAPGYDLGVEFRANPAAELEGNKIIEWSITVGSHTLKQREPARALHWEPGTPIVVSLRLARDGPVAPAPDPQQPGMWVEDRTVHYRFNDLWSLYSMIASHREPDGPGRSDAKAQVLRFEFPIFSNGELLKGLPDSRARVYLKLAVSPAGKRAPLAWPGSFPSKAPEWTLQ